MADPISIVHDALEESARVKRAMTDLAPAIAAAAQRIVEAFRRGRHLYACGNGGSACDAMHLVEELVARYKLDRPGLPAHHLLDAATLTCWSNDYEFDGVFARQVEAMAADGDILVALSTSGSSPNIIGALEAASARGVVRIGLTGRDGGRMRELCDELLVVPSMATERIQEGHITIIHLLCDLVERTLFGDLRSDAQATPDRPPRE